MFESFSFNIYGHRTPYNFMKHNLEIRSTDNGKGLSHCLWKEIAHVYDRQIVHDYTFW
jgi:hypothetical protein